MHCKVILLGRVGREPELKFMPNGTQLCNFSIAVTEKVKDEKKTDWYKVNIWGKLGELASKYLKKGNLVYVEGKLSTKERTDKDGKTRTELIVNASEFKNLTFNSEDKSQDTDTYYSEDSHRSSKPGSFNKTSGTKAYPISDEITEDDIPF